MRQKAQPTPSARDGFIELAAAFAGRAALKVGKQS
jgi:hypothetical protein